MVIRLFIKIEFIIMIRIKFLSSRFIIVRVDNEVIV